jgi:hypothetical protein
MNNVLIIKQKVANLESYLADFERLAPQREAAGLHEVGRYHDDDDKETVIIVFDVHDLKKAKAFMKATCGPEERKPAGRIGPPTASPEEFWLTNGRIRADR